MLLRSSHIADHTGLVGNLAAALLNGERNLVVRAVEFNVLYIGSVRVLYLREELVVRDLLRAVSHDPGQERNRHQAQKADQKESSSDSDFFHCRPPCFSFHSGCPCQLSFVFLFSSLLFKLTLPIINLVSG